MDQEYYVSTSTVELPIIHYIQSSCEGIFADDGSDTGFVSKILCFLFLFLLPTKVDEEPGNQKVISENL